MNIPCFMNYSRLLVAQKVHESLGECIHVHAYLFISDHSSFLAWKQQLIYNNSMSRWQFKILLRIALGEDFVPALRSHCRFS